jgi:hypothetical protein
MGKKFQDWKETCQYLNLITSDILTSSTDITGGLVYSQSQKYIVRISEIMTILRKESNYKLINYFWS